MYETQKNIDEFNSLPKEGSFLRGVAPEKCAYCDRTDICKYGGDSQPICYKCAGIDQDGNVFKGGGISIKRNEPKIQRNENCPCGSGKKFKKCCLK